MNITKNTINYYALLGIINFNLIYIPPNTFKEPEQDLILKSLDLIPKNCKNVLIYRYGLKDGKFKTLEETGKKFKVGKERVRQIESKGLRMLKRKQDYMYSVTNY